MEEPLNLAETFRKCASVRVVEPEDPAEFERLLLGAWETGRKSWPRLAVTAQDFVCYLAQRLSAEDEGRPLAEVLKERRPDDLYLACACVLKKPGAHQELEAGFFSKLSALLRYLNLPEADLEDVCQNVIIQLLVGTTKGPQLAEYRGRGSLMSWLQAIAVRQALRKGVPRELPEQHVLDFLEYASPPGFDPELDYMKRHYRGVIQELLNQARKSLSSEQQYLLKLYLKDRLSTTELGKIFGVSQPTISRWLQKIRDELYTETKRLLKERFDISSQEFKSLMEIIKSQLDINFSKLPSDEEDKDKKDKDKDKKDKDKDTEDEEV
jgi:RNA polymerase sigma-70 factor (ECF subfamily)